MILVYRYRVKSLTGLLNRQSRACNFVWNFCNDTQKHALKWNKRWPTGFDLNVLTTGTSRDLRLHSGTVNAVCEQYAKSRKQFNRPYLRYRGRKSLGWVPLKGRELKREGDAFRFAGNTFRVFNSRPLPEGKIKDGTNFSRDRRGNWFLNIVIEVSDVAPRQIQSGVGIDLGLKDFATLSTGEKVENPRHFRKLEEKLAKAQRANKRRLATKIHWRIANARLDFHHKLSTRLVREFDYIAVGNVNSKSLAKTSMAKSVMDAGWSSFRQQLAYKSVRDGAMFEEVDERFTTQVCSHCGALPESRPRGIADLGIREWQCSDCGCMHDRDTNAASNTLRRGHATPVVGISVRQGGEDVNPHGSLPRRKLHHTTEQQMNIQQTTEQAIQTLQSIHRDVMSPATKQQIEQELIELAQEAFLLRSCGKDNEIGTGVITDHVRAVAANAVKTHRLECKLRAIAFYERNSAQAPTQH